MEMDRQKVSVWLKNAVMAAGDVLMQGFGSGGEELEAKRQQAKNDSRDTILSSFLDEWFAAGGEEIAIVVDGMKRPKVAWREGDTYKMEDDLGDIASWRGPCIAVDALRGSLAYARGVRDFCVSAAYINEGALCASVVFDPSSVELYHAVSGLGAYLNGKAISASDANDIRGAYCSTDIYTARTADPKALQSLMKQAGQMRTAAASTLEMCFASCGRTDAYFASDQPFCSFAAGLLVANEAGAYVTNFEGEGNTGIGILGQRKNLVVSGKALAGQLTQITGRFYRH